MNARVLIFLVDVLCLVWEGFLGRLADEQRKKPLPEAVADFYAPERYQTYLNRVADEKKARWAERGVRLLIDSAILFSPVFAAAGRAAGGNPYLASFFIFALYAVTGTAVETAFDYYDKFVIAEKYGLNRQTRGAFARDAAIGGVFSFGLMSLLLVLFVFAGTHMEAWTNGFTVGPGGAALICGGITAAAAAFVLGASALSIAVLRMQYRFTPLPEGELRDRIMALQETSRKKVKRICVYDESKKSTAKNAFLLKFLWHREFGIADNFLNENAEDELLAVLSHEIGHLKHRRNLLNVLSWAEAAALILLLGVAIVHPQPLLALSAWTRASFGIGTTNYYVLLAVLLSFWTPLSGLQEMFTNYRSRAEEYEADREAVRNGLGEALIRTFRRLSSDELVNVNPHPFIEFLEYSHPGMARRIAAIRAAERERDEA